MTGTGIAAFVFELMMAIYIIPHSFKMIGMKWSDLKIKNFNKIKTEVDIWKKFTVKNIKDGDNIPVINQNYIKTYIPTDGGGNYNGGGWADTGGGDHASIAPTMHLVHFFKYNALISTTLN